MSEPVDVVISTARAGSHDDVAREIPVEYRTRTTQFGPAVRALRQCMGEIAG